MSTPAAPTRIRIVCKGEKQRDRHKTRVTVAAVVERADDGAWHVVDHPGLHKALRREHDDSYEPGEFNFQEMRPRRPRVEKGGGEGRRFEFRCPLPQCRDNVPAAAVNLEPLLDMVVAHGGQQITLAWLRMRLDRH